MARLPKSKAKKSSKNAKSKSKKISKISSEETPSPSPKSKAKPQRSKPEKPEPLMGKSGAPSKTSLKSAVSPYVGHGTKASPRNKGKAVPIPSTLEYQEQRARIAARAYEFFEERCRIGADVQDWLRAEREIMG